MDFQNQQWHVFYICLLFRVVFPALKLLCFYHLASLYWTQMKLNMVDVGSWRAINIWKEPVTIGAVFQFSYDIHCEFIILSGGIHILQSNKHCYFHIGLVVAATPWNWHYHLGVLRWVGGCKDMWCQNSLELVVATAPLQQICFSFKRIHTLAGIQVGPNFENLDSQGWALLIDQAIRVLRRRNFSVNIWTLANLKIRMAKTEVMGTCGFFPM